MTDLEKRARLREILADPKAPSPPALPILYLPALRRIADTPLSISPVMRFTRAFVFPTKIF
jgi:hypothetical protein